MQLSWIPSDKATSIDLERAEAHYGRATRKLVQVLRGDGKRPCLDVIERLESGRRLLHPYVVEWFNRQRLNLEQGDRDLVFACFDELATVEARVQASIARRTSSTAEYGVPFDLQTRASDIPHAARHLRSIAAEAYGSSEFETLRLVEEPDAAMLEVLRDAWSTLVHYWPEAAHEVREVTHTISFFSNDFLIGGALQSFLGGIFLTRRRIEHGVQLAEEILHEASHTRLFYMMLDRVLWTNPEHEMYETVLRKDRRPFWGLFHQLFVLTRLSEYYRRVVQERPEFTDQYREICDQAARAAATVERIGLLTTQGNELFATLRVANGHHAEPRHAEPRVMP
jgi:HEXXH motif-containing protein